MASKNLIRIDNVYFYYTQIAKPGYKYKSNIEKEFKTTVILSREQARSFKANKYNKNVKDIPTNEFEAKFKSPPPYPDQEDQYFISVSRPATYKDGNPKPEWTYPKAYFAKDGKVIEASSTLIGNNSQGHLSLEVSDSPTGGAPNVSLNSVVITNLVEFTQSTPGSEWGDLGEVSVDPDNIRTLDASSETKGSSRTPIEPDIDVSDLPF